MLKNDALISNVMYLTTNMCVCRNFLKTTHFQAAKFDIYVYYCTNKPKSTQLLVDHGSPLFENFQRAAGVDQPLAAYLIKPVQRFVLSITFQLNIVPPFIK